MTVPDPGFRYLNRDGAWLDFTLHGIELTDGGALTLSTVPALSGASGDLTGVPEPAVQCGLEVDASGVIYFTLPGDNRVWRVDPCDGSVGPVACLDLNLPRGLAVHSQRDALLVCDSGNHRVAIFDIGTWQLVESRGGFDTPVAIGIDSAGNCYVADSGTKRVSKFSPSGDADTAFNSAVEGASSIHNPTAIGIAGTHLFVLDADLLEVLVFDASGKLLNGPRQPWENLQRPVGLAVTADSIYVGDNALRRVLRYQNAESFGFAGEAAGFAGPVAALAIGLDGEVLVNYGQAAAPLALAAGQGFRKEGLLWSGPISAGGLAVAWHSLHAQLEGAGDAAHAQLFVFTGGHAPKVDPTAANPFPAPWKAAPLDVTDVYVGGDPSASIQVGARFTGDGTQSPRLSELKARFNQKTYFPYLPGVYNDPTPSRDFFVRLLALFEGFNATTEDTIARLPELFDAASISADFLPWLATWMAVEIDQRWDVSMQRQAIAGAYKSFGRRGTLEGLRESIAFETGIPVVIEEPIQDVSWWVLPGAVDACSPPVDTGEGDAGSCLGFTTMLAQSAPQGAVVGSTAILDRSRITAPEDLGTPLFDETAHRFSITLRSGQTADQMAAVARIVDREKPAHTVYHVCKFEARMRVGFQARVGIDTIVGKSAPLGRLNETSLEGGVSVGGQDGLRIGIHSRIGTGLRL
jgi:phage tail-like protein